MIERGSSSSLLLPIFAAVWFLAQGGAVTTSRVFLLSPANCGGTRARQVLSPRAAFALAERLRSADGAPLGELFAFVSGLYFRGKLTYARRFAAPPEPDNVTVGSGVHIITPNAGLRAPDTLVTAADMQAFADADVHPNNPLLPSPLERSARALHREIGPDCDVVLLGSIASPKYVDILRRDLRRPAAVSDRLRRPRRHEPRRAAAAKGGRRRGARIRAGAGAVRHGVRPPRLEKLQNGKR